MKEQIPLGGDKDEKEQEKGSAPKSLSRPALPSIKPEIKAAAKFKCAICLRIRNDEGTLCFPNPYFGPLNDGDFDEPTKGDEE